MNLLTISVSYDLPFSQLNLVDNSPAERCLSNSPALKSLMAFAFIVAF